MPNLEQPQQEPYNPRFNSIKELGQHPELSYDEELLEVARLRFTLNLQTVELLKSLEQVKDPELHDQLEEIVKLVALTDLSDVGEVVSSKDKQKLERALELIKDFKEKLNG